jgi:glycosyltransferase involved in cell wall biosynthesis
LLAELPDLGVELYLYSDHSLDPSHLARLPAGSYHVRVAPEMRYPVWEQRWLPRQCASDRVRVLHTPFNFGLPWKSDCPRVLTLHDAIGQFDHDGRRTWRERLSRESLQIGLYHWISRTRADRVITDSEHSTSDLVNHLGVNHKNISVIYLAADPRFHQPVGSTERVRIREKYAFARPYVFYVGGWEDRKNIPFLVHAFHQANLAGVQLVLAGGRERQRAEIEDLASTLGMADSVSLLGWVDDADLPGLYAEALCFVYPSSYEGFGLQLCEAMAVGCPTLAARATRLPEILGAGGETFPIDDPQLLSTLLRTIATDRQFRAGLAHRATRRSQDFSWRQTARQTVEVYAAL